MQRSHAFRVNHIHLFNDTLNVLVAFLEFLLKLVSLFDFLLILVQGYSWLLSSLLNDFDLNFLEKEIFDVSRILLSAFRHMIMQTG